MYMSVMRLTFHEPILDDDKATFDEEEAQIRMRRMMLDPEMMILMRVMEMVMKPQ